jgi:hypothetical protein
MYVPSYFSPPPSRWRPPSYRGPRILRLPVVYVKRGMGATTPAQTIAAGITSGATYGASTAIATGSPVVGGVTGGLMATAGILAVIPGGQIPAAFIAAAASLVAPIASLFKGCGQSCIQATQFANQVQQAADQLNSLYWGSPVRTVSMQQAALVQMNELWQYLASHCQAVGGQGGAQCIADRQRGGKYDFFAHYVDPIQNDSGVVPDPSASSGVLQSLGVNPAATFAGVPLTDWLLPAALLGAALFLE